MKPIKRNQAYMKGLLLLALAANVSWQPAMKALNTTDLASGKDDTAASTGTGEAAAAAAGSQTLSTTGNGVTASTTEGTQRAEPARTQGTASPGSVTVTPSTTATLTAPIQITGHGAKDAGGKEYFDKEPEKVPVGLPQEEQLAVCKDLVLKVTWTEYKIAGENKTFVEVVDTKSTKYKFGWVISGPMTKAFEPAVKKGIEDQIEEKSLKLKAAAGETCEKPVVAQKKDNIDEEDDGKGKRKRKLSEKSLKLLKDNCDVDEDGDKLDFEDAYQCDLDQLENMEITGEKEYQVRKKATAALTKITKRMRSRLASQLRSRAPGVAEEAQKMMEDLDETIEDVASTYNIDEDTVTLLQRPFVALKDSAAAYKRSLDYEKEAERVRLRLRSARASGSIFGESVETARLRQLKQAMEFNVGGSMIPRLEDYLAQDMLSDSEFDAFTTPYEDLRAKMDDALRRGDFNRSMLGSLSPRRDRSTGDRNLDRILDRDYRDDRGRDFDRRTDRPGRREVNAPRDLYAVRAGLAGTNLGNYGLNNMNLRPSSSPFNSTNSVIDSRASLPGANFRSRGP